MANKKIIELMTIASIAIAWVMCDLINFEVFHFLKSDKYLYSIYLLAGLRLVAIILFGYIGFFGIFLGHTFASIAIRHLDATEAIWLGFLSSFASLLAHKLWQSFIDKNDSFYGISPIQLFYLVVINATLVALFRFSFLFITNHNTSIEIFYGTISANISGSLIFLYLIKAGNSAYRRIKT